MSRERRRCTSFAVPRTELPVDRDAGCPMAGSPRYVDASGRRPLRRGVQEKRVVYLVDWGGDCEGARFLLVSAEDPGHLFDELDMIGDPLSARWCEWDAGVWLPFDLEADEAASEGGDDLLDARELRGPGDRHCVGHLCGDGSARRGLAWWPRLGAVPRSSEPAAVVDQFELRR